MTATDELRRLLDERGEYYKVSGNRTWWGRPIDARTGEPINVFHNQAQPMGEDRLLVELQLATPEQAIEATLGKGECDAEVEVVEFSQMQEIHRFTCSECGDSFGAEEHGGLFGLVLNKVKLPNYCPNCGRRLRK